MLIKCLHATHPLLVTGIRKNFPVLFLQFCYAIFASTFAGHALAHAVLDSAMVICCALCFHSMPSKLRRTGTVVGIATGYELEGPGIESRWRRDFPPVQTGPGTHPASCTMGTGSFPGVKSGRGVTPTPHPLLVSWSRKSRAIPLLPLWVVRSVQSLSACTRVHFTFFYLQVYKTM